MNTPSLDGKIAIITGAGSGIGRASAQALAAAGATVVVSDINLGGAEETAHLIEGAGGRVMAIQTDVTDTATVNALIERTVGEFGRIDYAHNNAGIAYTAAEMGPVHEHSEALWMRIIDVNLNGVWRCMKAELPVMAAAGGGAIVNTASVLGLVGAPGYSAYIASKHGVAGLTKTAALEYGRANIRVNAVCPGFIRTAMVTPVFENERMLQGWIRSQAIRRPGEPEEVAAAVVWLCSDAASFVTGHMMTIDGGQTAA